MHVKVAKNGEGWGGWARWLFPARCAGCGVTAEGLCGVCLESALPAPPQPPPPGVDAWHAPFAYQGPVREAIARVKYRNERAALGVLVAAMVGALPGRLDADMVTWAPSTTARRRERGFDHAELLARAVARRLRLPARPLLRRRDVLPQTGRGRRERLAGPALEAAGPAPGSVLVVDDVATTGATLRACAAALRSHGCLTVVAVTAARTPLKPVAVTTETDAGRVAEATRATSPPK